MTTQARDTCVAAAVTGLREAKNGLKLDSVHHKKTVHRSG